MAPRYDVKDVAAFCEDRPGERGGVSTVVFPNGSRAKWPANTVQLVPSMVAAALPDGWGCCDSCDRRVPREQLHHLPACTLHDEGTLCDRCV